MNEVIQGGGKSSPVITAEVPTDPRIEITLIVPVYEEEENILPFLTEVKSEITLPHRIIIIFDDDRDGTLKRKQEILQMDPTIVFVRNERGRGIVNAFKTGFSTANTRYIVPIMADLSDTPETVVAMYEKMREGYDLVVASRYCRGGKKIGGPFIKYLLSLTANITLHRLTKIPIHDMTNAFIMYKREILDKINIRSTGGFEITMELIARAYILGCKIAEVPTINRERAAGKSRFKVMQWILKYLYWYFYILIFSCANRINAHFMRDTQKVIPD
jgi:glycosyltransferase involved in cell wall biosynthesis